MGGVRPTHYLKQKYEYHKTMTINYLGNEITLKYTFRGYIIYENIMGSTYTSAGMKELIVLFYSMLVAANPEVVNDFEGFLNWLDTNQNELNKFSSWLVDNLKRNNEVKDQNIETQKDDNESVEGEQPKK